jgi:uncharacterized OsmC-like protein
MYLPLTLFAIQSAAVVAMTAVASEGAQVMNLVGPEQKAAVEKSVRELSAAKSAQEAAGTNKAVVALVHNQHSVASVRGFSVVQDEPSSVAGGATGPTPTDYFMVALGSCQNVVFVRYAALAQVPITSLETTVTGSWDRRGLYGIGDIDPGYREITIESRVSTDAPDVQVADVARRTHRGCPIYATLRKETALTLRLIVNGHTVPL